MLAILARIVAFAAGAAVLAFAVLLFQPGVYGPDAPAVNLGLFLETYRPVVATLVAMAGAGLVLAAIKRKAAPAVAAGYQSMHFDMDDGASSEQPAVHSRAFDIMDRAIAAAPVVRRYSGGSAVARPLW